MYYDVSLIAFIVNMKRENFSQTTFPKNGYPGINFRKMGMLIL